VRTQRSCAPISKGLYVKSASVALENQAKESTGQDATSISGVRVAVSLEEGTEVEHRGLHLRAIVITPEPVSSESDGASERFQVEFAHDTKFFAGLSRDMSDGGIIVATYRDLPIGSGVHLDFELPTGVPIQTRGEVRWIREDSAAARRGLAIVFREISQDSLRHIAEYCLVHPPLFLDLS